MLLLYFFYMYDRVVLNCNALLTAVYISINWTGSAYASRFREEEFLNFWWRRHFPNSSVLCLTQNVETLYVNSPSHCARSRTLVYSKFHNSDSSSFFPFWFSFTLSVYALKQSSFILPFSLSLSLGSTIFCRSPLPTLTRSHACSRMNHLRHRNGQTDLPAFGQIAEFRNSKKIP